MSTEPDSTSAGVPRVTQEEYSTFLRGLALQNIWLAYSHVENLSGPATPGNANLSLSANLQWQVHETSLTLLHGYDITLARQQAEGGQDAIALTVAVKFGVQYTAIQPPNEDLMEVFKHSTLLSATWPYLREYFGSLTARMNWSAYVLPLLVIDPASLLLAVAQPTTGAEQPVKASTGRRTKGHPIPPGPNNP